MRTVNHDSQELVEDAWGIIGAKITCDCCNGLGIDYAETCMRCGGLGWHSTPPSIKDIMFNLEDPVSEIIAQLPAPESVAAGYTKDMTTLMVPIAAVYRLEELMKLLREL